MMQLQRGVSPTTPLGGFALREPQKPTSARNLLTPIDHKELRDDFYNFLKTMSQDCRDALKPYIGTLSKLAYGAALYDVNEHGSEPASNYVRDPSAANRTLGQFFDARGRDALSISYSTKDGIYFRSISTFSGDGMYLLLHEMMHIVVPRTQVGRGEQDLADRLGISQRGNETWSHAVSRYFSSKCNPAELGP